jgi:predicted ATP-binding protein involved in virulence
MLEKLHLKNVGPAPEMELEFAPRINIITGDNGVGKSFILDVAWWALTENWIFEVNPQVENARPSKKAGALAASIFSNVVLDLGEGKIQNFPNTSQFISTTQSWESHTIIEQISMVLHYRSDGTFALRDPARDQRGLPVFVFSNKTVWDGAEQQGKTILNGLIRDWANWQLEGGVAFKQLRTALELLSPSLNEQLIPGSLTRISVEDARDIPTLQTSYGHEIPVIYASSAIRRILALAYMIVWSWQEHLRIVRLTDRRQASELILLIDELEQHLHPRWQRIILESVLNVAKKIMAISDVKIQIITTTHSPMVMASLEPLFDPEQDAWFDLNLVDGAVTLEKMPWRRRGDANAWLKSEAFDLPSTYSREAGQAMEKASALARASRVSKKRFLEVDEELRRYLSDTDPFWIRWRSLGENKGWL